MTEQTTVPAMDLPKDPETAKNLVETRGDKRR